MKQLHAASLFHGFSRWCWQTIMYTQLCTMAAAARGDRWTYLVFEFGSLLDVQLHECVHLAGAGQLGARQHVLQARQLIFSSCEDFLSRSAFAGAPTTLFCKRGN